MLFLHLFLYFRNFHRILAEFRFFCKTILKISFRFEDDGDDDGSPNGENSSDELAVGGRMAYGFFAYIVG